MRAVLAGGPRDGFELDAGDDTHTINVPEGVVHSYAFVGKRVDEAGPYSVFSYTGEAKNECPSCKTEIPYSTWYCGKQECDGRLFQLHREKHASGEYTDDCDYCFWVSGKATL